VLDPLKKPSGKGRFSGSGRVWLELESECGSTSPEGCDAALALLFLIALLALVDESFTAREHEIDHAGSSASVLRAGCVQPPHHRLGDV
jgi:hypothetical protein